MRKLQPMNGDDPNKRVGVWIRVSTEDQAKGESPEHHERRARAYAETGPLVPFAWSVRSAAAAGARRGSRSTPLTPMGTRRPLREHHSAVHATLRLR